MIIKKLFGNKKKQKAVVFVNFDFWCFSVTNIFKIEPNIEGFRENLFSKYNVEDVFVFADFSNPLVYKYKSELEAYFENVIDTRSRKISSRKNYTDMMLVDNVYRYMNDHPKINQYCFFFGSGHFAPMLEFLKLKMKKNIIICGVNGALSTNLIELADEIHEEPSYADLKQKYYRMIVLNFNDIFLSEKRDKIYPTFMSTVKAVSIKHGLSDIEVTKAMQELLEMKVLYYKSVTYEMVKKVTLLYIDWSKAIEYGLWSRDDYEHREELVTSKMDEEQKKYFNQYKNN